jgi:hypothetical protein
MSSGDDEQRMTHIRPRDALGIADRAMTNLRIINESQEGHRVTAIVATALTLLLLPFDEWFRKGSGTAHMVAGSAPWLIRPSSDMELTPLQHIRNAFAHGEVEYDVVPGAEPDSRDPTEAVIRFKDRPGGGDYNWWASIRADELEAYLAGLHSHLYDLVHYE